MERRRALCQLGGLVLGGLGMGLSSPGLAHTPYRQWKVYRQRFLLILCSKDDPPAYPLAKDIVGVLVEALPESRARVARAPHAWRMGSLLATEQLDVALLRPEDAQALAQGVEPLDGFGPVPLRRIVQVGEFWLVCREDFAPDHAYLLAEALLDHGEVLPAVNPGLEAVEANSPVPFHRGIIDGFALSQPQS
ncbi:MAG: hypothetical protein ACFCBW_08535 [Candidatus Competibacterales bacterium]